MEQTTNANGDKRPKRRKPFDPFGMFPDLANLIPAIGGIGFGFEALAMPDFNDQPAGPASPGPPGIGLQISIQDNHVKEIAKTRLWHVNQAGPGSSRSPVFDRKGNLVGIHQGYDADRKANVGIRMDRIIDVPRDRLMRMPAARPSDLGANQADRDDS